MSHFRIHASLTDQPTRPGHLIAAYLPHESITGMRLPLTRRNAPLWLPAIDFVRDFLAWQYIFSFEPGITEQAVYRGKLFMLPGSLVRGGFEPMAINIVIAFVAGLFLRWSSKALRNNDRTKELS
jgi:hypothetical protein